jgi:hypothetical protein
MDTDLFSRVGVAFFWAIQLRVDLIGFVNVLGWISERIFTELGLEV